MQRLPSEKTTVEPDVQFIDRNALLAFNIAQFDTWPYMEILPEPIETFNSSDYSTLGTYSDIPVSPWTFEEMNRDISFGVPLIFSISPNVERLLSEEPILKKNILDICNMIASLVSTKDLNAIGEISVFHEDGARPKLFITYGIVNKPYGEILTLWDDVCKKLAEKLSVETLKEIAVIFDQL
jgi:hypothetical protein